MGAARRAPTLGSFDPAMLVHGEQSIELFGPIPPEGTVRTTSVVTGIYDKGSGALVVSKSTSVDAPSGEPRFATTTSLFVRGEGGFGGDRGPSSSAGPLPDREPDDVVTYATRPDQALLYRLSGDRNPLHSDPVFAKRAGFDRPILHGLCTYGFTGRALLHTVCGSDPARFRSMAGRFSRPTFPGDTLTISIWADGDGVRFRTDNQRGETVIDAGTLRVLLGRSCLACGAERPRARSARCAAPRSTQAPVSSRASRARTCRSSSGQLRQVDPHQRRGGFGAGAGQDGRDHGVAPQVRVSLLGQPGRQARQPGTRLHDRHGHVGWPRTARR